MAPGVLYSLLYVKYIRFLDSANHTYELRVEYKDSVFYAEWSRLGASRWGVGGYATADSPEDAAGKALEDMYDDYIRTFASTIRTEMVE